MIDDRPPGGARTLHDGRSEIQLPTFCPPFPFAPPYDATPDVGARARDRFA